MVQQLISRMAGKCTRPANGPEEALKNLIGLKTWLTRACQNATDETQGRMSLRTEIGVLIKNLNDSEN